MSETTIRATTLEFKASNTARRTTTYDFQHEQKDDTSIRVDIVEYGMMERAFADQMIL